MKNATFNFLPLFFLITLLAVLACSYKSKSDFSNNPLTLVGSTPGDEVIKSFLDISKDTPVDFIRWHLTLHSPNTFTLQIAFGESKPNTLRFKVEEKKQYGGTYTISSTDSKNNNSKQIIYRLKSQELKEEILLLKINENLFHVLDRQKNLLVGNGGWSYTLNRKETVSDFSVLKIVTDLPADTAQQIIYDGRTPCMEFAKEYNLNVPSDCFKLKWKIIFKKDPKTLQPTTYEIRRVEGYGSVISQIGRWLISKGTPNNPEAVIYQMIPDKAQNTVSLLLGDENVLFFLRKDYSLYTGNENFSFTLNKRK